MKDKIKHLFTVNLGLKIVAFVFSALLWLVVVNVDDPSQIRSFTVPVTIINEQAILDQGKYYNLVNNNNTVSVRVSAKRSIIEKLSPSDFTAIADLAQLQNNNRVPVDIAVNRYSSSVTISSKQLYLPVSIEEQMKSRFVIEGHTKGNLANNAVVTGVKVSPNVITVTGRIEKVAVINQVCAYCDIDGIDETITENVVPVFYDANGEEVDIRGLELSLDSVDITVNVTHIKDVPVVVTPNGTIDSELVLESVDSDVSKITVCGEPEAIAEVSQLIIGDTIDLSNIYETTEFTVDLTSYLPSGVAVFNRNPSMATVTVKVGGNVSRSLSVPSSNFEITGLAEGTKAEIESEYVTITVTGRQSYVNNLDESSVRGYIDLTDIPDGVQFVPAEVLLTDGLTASPVNISVRVESPNSDNATLTSPGAITTPQTQR